MTKDYLNGCPVCGSMEMWNHKCDPKAVERFDRMARKEERQPPEPERTLDDKLEEAEFFNNYLED